MSKTAGRVLVFAASAAVLVIEVLAGRLVAPYLGVSLTTFTGIIGIILAGISVGAWAGGHAADRTNPRTLIGPLLGSAGFLTMVAPPIVDSIGPSIAGSGVFGIIVLATLGFFAPATVLSAIPPVVVKDRLASLAETGAVVGSYSAVGTAGALFGTFFTGFVLIAALATRPIMLGLGIILVIAGVSTSIRWRTTSAGLSILAFAVLPAAILVIDRGPCQYETAYHCAIVTVDPDRPSGRLLWLDRTRNSYVDLEDPSYIEFRYLRVVNDILSVHYPDNRAIDTLAVGGGGFTFPALLEATRPGSTTHVLEIDATLIEIGHTQLGLDPATDIVIGDARTTIDGTADGSIDFVLGDAFSGLSVPWHLTTLEFVDEVQRVLRPGGIYALNLIDTASSRFVRAETATLAAVFDHVVVIAPQERLTGEAGGNFVVVASDDPLQPAEVARTIKSRGGEEVVLPDADLEAFIDQAPILTDDYAPVDQMLAS